VDVTVPHHRKILRCAQEDTVQALFFIIKPYLKMNLMNLPLVVSIALGYNKNLIPSYSKHVVGSERSFV
jgi:hypothetical protein